MGGKLCCTNNFTSEIPPLTIKTDRASKFEHIKFHLKESKQADLIGSYKDRGLTYGNQNKHSSKMIEIFQYKLESPVHFISFSHRKYLGFRNKYEFDRKRVLIGSRQAFAIISYDMNDEPHELMSMEIDEEEEIQMIQFLDDESPQNVLLITYDYSLQKTVSRILNIRNETVNRFQDLKKEFEYKLNLQLMVESQLSQSKQARATFMHHNYFYSLDEKHSDFLVEQERSLMPSFVTNTADKGNSSFLSPNNSSLSSILQQENNQIYDTNSNNISKNSFIEQSDQSDKSENSGSQNNSYHGMYASHGVNSVNSSQIFSFKDKQMYEIFDFQEQIINDGFTKVCYFNKDARRKILFTSNLKNQFYCFNIKQHIKMTTNTVSMFQATDKTHSNAPSTKVSRHQSQQDLSVLQQPSVQKNITPKKLAELPAVNPTKDKLSNSFKNSQAQIQEPSFQTQPPNPKIPKCVELHQDRLYVIYKRLPQIDILQVNGGLIQRIKLDEIISREENMTLDFFILYISTYIISLW